MSELIAKCEVCQAMLDEEDLFCANCGTEAPHQTESKSDAGKLGAARTSTHNFECSGCGASMSYDASAGRLRCPFCGSEKMEPLRDATVLAPQRVIPFVLEKERAIATMRSWLTGGFWRPSDLSQQAMVVSMTAVYVPFWVFAATTHTFWTADTSQTPPGARGDWYPMSGEHRGSYSGHLIGASGVLSPRETAALCPFDLATGVDPDAVDLDNMTVEQFSVPRKYARPLARQGLEAREAQDCQRRYVPGRSRNVKVNVRIDGLTSDPVLLPVWIMAYRYQDRVYRFLANGQTGKSTGAAPHSYKKLAAVIGFAVLAVILLMCLLGVFGALAR